MVSETFSMELKPGCEITRIDEIMKIKFSYKPSREDMLLGLDVTAEKFPALLRMWVFADGISLSSQELQTVSEHAKTLFPPNSKLALVSPTDLGFGLSRIYNVYREDGATNVMVFRSEEEAEEWLRTK